MEYEIYYKTEGRKKTYLVFDWKYRSDAKYFIGIKNIARKYFKSSIDRIEVVPGYVLSDELYLDYRPVDSKQVAVAYYV